MYEDEQYKYINKMRMIVDEKEQKKQQREEKVWLLNKREVEL